MFHQLMHTLGLSQLNKEPYGNVHYADPGFRSDGKKRYPLEGPTARETVIRIRAAWSYIHHKHDRSFYTAEQLKHIEDEIVAAWKQHINPDGPPEANKK